MTWSIERTDTFLDALKEFKKNTELLNSLEKKLQRLQEDPYAVGGRLSGKLHGWHSTRLVGKFRLLFKIDDNQKIVYLGAIDHRGNVYEQK